MPSTDVPDFTIIGASPAGYTFALSLLHHNPDIDPSSIRIIEANADWRKPGGPFWLAPNALRILDQLKLTTGGSIYEKIHFSGYRARQHNMRNESGEWLGALPHGSKDRWGYDGLRVERGIILKILAEEVEKRGIKVEYQTSLREVVSEEDNGLLFKVRRGGQDGDIVTLRTKRLIGADGAHSRTRNFVCGHEVQPAYSGNFMIGGYLPRSKLRWTKSFREAERNKEYSLSITDRGGTFLMIPVDRDAELLGIGRQWPMPEPDRQGWDALNADKQKLHEMFTGDADKWSDFPRGILEAAREESPDMWLVWPMYLLPKLDRWVSEGGRAVIIGDAAHTLIPAAAQGACQAVEDAWTLAQAYAQVEDEANRLRRWQEQRIQRVGQIAKLSVQLMNVRLAPAEQAKLASDQLFPLTGTEEERFSRLDWLYGAQL